MKHRDHSQRSGLRPSRLYLAALLLLIGTFVLACGDDPVNPVASETSSLELAKGGAPVRPSTWMSLLADGVDPASYAARYSLSYTVYGTEVPVVVMEGSTDLTLHLLDPESLTFEEVKQAKITDPIDLIMGFQEGFWDFDDFESQGDLDPILLPTVHDHALGATVNVMTLDTGADFTHPHLAGHMVDLGVAGLEPAQEVANFVDDDGDGVVDGGFGHGTHVAGILVTCAPSSVIWPLKVLDDEGRGTSVQIAIGLAAALDHDPHILNLSLRLEDSSPTIDALLERLRAEGTIIMGAAGNNATKPVYPANHKDVIAVAATDAQDFVASFSAVGSDVELAAPGVHIVSSFPDTKYPQRFASGTSMACAVASGTLACLTGTHDRPVIGTPIERLLETAVDVLPTPTLVEEGRVAPTHALMVFPTVE